jgi:hypothetical protein
MWILPQQSKVKKVTGRTFQLSDDTFTGEQDEGT